MGYLVAADLDGVFGRQLDPAPSVVISGRTWSEYDLVARTVAQQMPLYIRGQGVYGDRMAAAKFKAKMIELLGVTRFYEDDELQISVISTLCPRVDVVHVPG